MEAYCARPGTCAADPSGFEPTRDDHTTPPHRKGRDVAAVQTSQW
jgi:hypothetical protein